ncbi:Pre-mRNA-processing ATP-dependent RNA helicase PRP5 [Pestalotiopsis fici W106-1]|uniref:RNA helicase n=1 Tax=Pestalotiopsis fici (strain W106-1 / CGMCC3.15140) TaxID=1229662 RepID=W3XN21_PESFW|nr:Pre-mRNA-processing ATP-dependent RNA helicase PRP5 [Pestalotiopsis fici W106-1]ETS87384.1 Pre-mRNA-processing ATP-dependent RNA helicase PRP5 [Pestalotiopsis fici W106-1]
MARLRDSRSPSPAGSSRRYRRDDDRRRDRDRDRDRRRRSRTPPRPRDEYRRRDRSLDRSDDYHRDGRDRRRSRDRYNDGGRDRDRDWDRDKGRRDRDDRRKRDDSRDRARSRREGTTDSHRSGPTDSRARPAAEVCPPFRSKHANIHTSRSQSTDTKSKPNAPPAAAQSDADKKAERLAKLAAWKKKQELEKEKAKEATPGATRKLLAEMDQKANGSSAATPSVASPTSAVASPAASTSFPSPATPYSGKFDPKEIAKKSARVHESSAAPKLGSIGVQLPPSKPAAPVSGLPKASALPKAKTSGFGFHKQNADTDKIPQKRKLILDEEEASDRKLAKLPSLPLADVDDTPYEVQDDDEEDADNFAGDEEEEAAAARAAQERREERMAQENAQQNSTMDIDESKAEVDATTVSADAGGQAMEVDEEEEVDALDAFMNDLESKPAPASKPAKLNGASQKKVEPEPEAFFSGDDDYDYAKNEDEPGAFLEKVNKARKKKDIPTVDYSKLDMAPLRKNFWVEPAELSEMTEAELTDLRLELDGIKVSGKDVPKPVQKWSQCALSRRTLDIIDSLGFDKPTPIQMQAFPAIMSGRDIIGIAKTGSGKTLAFLLPMFRHIKDQEPLRENDGPIGLIMTPTRELATQIHRDCKPFLKSMGLRAVCAYGGAPIKDHIAELKRGAEIVVCTPGRMIDLLAANQGRVTNLKRVTYVVLDEADRMFDMGFEPQVMKILNNMRPDRQNILFSATMPRIMDALAKKILKDPVEITVGGKSVVAPEITQIVEVREEDKKFIRLLELLGELYDKDEDARSLIFVERQEKADKLLKELLQKGYPCMSIHGGKDQVDRDSTISDFKAGVVPIMIATSVAARGLDVKQLKLVVNYDAPNHLEDYVHRAGRTGRAGNKGTAVTFVTGEQENSAYCIAKALEQSGQPVPEPITVMQKAFQEKLKAGKARDSSGFGGKGLDKLDQEREAARLRERKSHRTEGDEEEENEEEKAKEDKKADKALSAIQAAASAVSSRDAAPAKQPDLEPKFTIHKREDPPPNSGNNPLDKVSSARDAINARLGKSGQLRPGQPIDNKGPDAGAFHATLEINDFPQKARWAVTNRTNVAKILEATGVSITTKGTFYPAGKEVPPGGEAKLYILVEGDTEVVVSTAMTELTRLLKQGTMAAADAESRQPMGRYNVI